MLMFVSLAVTLASPVTGMADAEAVANFPGKSAGPGYGYGYTTGSGQGNGFRDGDGYGSSTMYDHVGSYQDLRKYDYGNDYMHNQDLRAEHIRGIQGHRHIKHVPIKIPYIDRNGCRTPGDVVCRPGDKSNCNYNLCILSDENDNLWKKPSMMVFGIPCPATIGVLSNFCNDNERLLRAAGLIDWSRDRQRHSYSQKKHVVNLNPCFLSRAKCDGNL